MDIKILNIEIKYDIMDNHTDNSKEREFKIQEYVVQFYLNKYIKSVIEIPACKELTIREIKEKIIDTYGHKNLYEFLREEAEKKRVELTTIERLKEPEMPKPDSIGKII